MNVEGADWWPDENAPDLNYVHAQDDHGLIARVLHRIETIGGTALGYKHRGRYTEFRRRDYPKLDGDKRIALTSCDHPTTFAIPARMDDPEKPQMHGCVVCDGADRWPRLRGA